MVTAKILREWLKNIPDDAQIFLDIDDFTIDGITYYYPVAPLLNIILDKNKNYHLCGTVDFTQ